MVNTTRLEGLLGTAPRGDAGRGAARNALALSGRRDQRQGPGARPPSPRREGEIAQNWADLAGYSRGAQPGARLRQFNAAARDPAVTARFDVLRTQLVQTFAARGLRSLAVTSPHGGSGSSFVVAGLLASLARRNDTRAIGLDLNAARPALHHYFEIAAPGPLGPLIAGDVAPASHLVRLTGMVALGLATPDTGPAPSPDGLRGTLAELVADYAPALIVCDLPPLLEGDAAMALLPQLDATLLVADATRTGAADMSACERLFDGKTEFLGAVLNNDTTPGDG